MSQVPMTDKKYDLEERTFQFAKEVSGFVKNVPKNIATFEYLKQVMRSSGSIGANYLEANEALGKNDFLMKLRICRKEAKESAYWLRLLAIQSDEQGQNQGLALANEATQLKKIFSTIIEKTKYRTFAVK